MITKILSTDDVEIVSLEEAMEHSRITDSYDELVVQMCLDGSHDIIEQYLNRRLRPTTIIGVVVEYRSVITLPYPPIVSVSSITCEDADETEITLVDGTHYKYDEVCQSIRFLGKWTDRQCHSHFRITFTCGYDTIESVPRAVKHAIRMMFATLYENREDIVNGVSTAQIPAPAKRICRSYRVRSI